MRKMFDVNLGRTPEIYDATAAKRHDVTCATSGHHLPAKALIGVARHELLRFPNRISNRFRVERFRDRDGVPMR